ncbi:MAG: thioredoxin family protein [Proteobacteria bacterium]|nr:thioredoxin family protein [Pseudomonadota bacterium]
MRRPVLTLLLALAALASLPAFAQQPDSPNMHVTLVPQTATPRPGTTITLAVVMQPRAGWHGYWRTPGDTGFPTRLAWTLPDTVTAGEPAYPVPGTLVIGGLMNHVYEREFALLVPLRIAAGVADGTRLPVHLKTDYLVCSTEVCVPESATADVLLTAGQGVPDASAAARFDAWRRAIPRALSQPGSYAVSQGHLRLTLDLPPDAVLTDPHLFVDTPDAVTYAAPQTFSRQGSRLLVETAASGTPAQLRGVLRTGPDSGYEFTASPAAAGAAPALPTPTASAASDARHGTLFLTLAAFAGAVLGGLILNVMPCVFPILSLKALSLARSGSADEGARSEALAYTGGVVLVCAALGALILTLRATGMQVGWAFQLQNPAVIFALILLTAAIGWNLAGLFELGMVTAGSGLAAQSGARGAFWTGALAAFVATPCTGPFMAAALGLALVLPAAAALLVFIGLGLGLALPFLAIGFVPSLRQRLPRPGAWMGTFRHILAVPMFLTTLGLAWVLGHQSGADGVIVSMGALLVMSLGLWITGLRQQAAKPHPWWPAVIATLLALATLVLLPHGTGTAARASETGMTGSTAGRVERFDPQRLAALRAQHRPVFLYLTADWCLSCKVNEKVAIEREETQQAFARAGVVTMVGDWTDGNATIGEFLESFHRPGVPLYLWYPPGGEPRVLPQILTPGLLIDLAQQGR